MYNILYYDQDTFSVDEIENIVTTLKEQLPLEMSQKLIILPKGTELVNYYEKEDLKQGVNW